MDRIAKYRSIWISDVHLATRGCKADFLLDFLRSTDSRYLYLVGDLIDGWRMKRAIFWQQSHNDVIQKILRKGRKGTRIFYLPGNHDEILRNFLDFQFGGICVTERIVHRTADGRRLLVLHGDEFDGVIRYARWLALLGASAYDTALILNHWLNVVRRRLGLPYWSISTYLKERVKRAVDFINNFKYVVVEEARRHHVDGVVCGHLHRPEMETVDGILYCNTGDWVENCTALVEHHDGRMELIEWTKIDTPATAPVPTQAPATVH